MSGDNAEKCNWQETLLSWTHPRAVAMLFLGFSAGLPILLIFSTLSLWLREAGVSRSAVTFFSWAALGYSFKFIWAPLIDLLPLPVLSRMLGRRRSWLLVAQFMIITAISCMALIDPAQSESLTLMALAAVLLGFSSATQDIVIDAYRIESAEQSLQAMLASMYIAGYRIAMLVAGAGALYLASFFGTSMDAYNYLSWEKTYFCMAAVMLVGVATTLIIKEPENTSATAGGDYSAMQYGRMLTLFICTALSFALMFFHTGNLIADVQKYIAEQFAVSGKLFSFLMETCRFSLAIGAACLVAWLLIGTGLVEKKMVKITYILPVKDFFLRYGGKTALLLLLLIGCYRVSDIVLGVISNVFYAEIGFSKNQIATIASTFGLTMTLTGGFIGGFLTVRFGVYSILFLGGVLSAVSNLFFMVLAGAGADNVLLMYVIAVDNLSAGIATTAFVAFLSSLTNIAFTATQYAIFSSLMTLFPKLLGGYSGTIVSGMGYRSFFLFTALLGMPVLVLVWFVKRLMEKKHLG